MQRDVIHRAHPSIHISANNRETWLLFSFAWMEGYDRGIHVHSVNENHTVTMQLSDIRIKSLVKALMKLPYCMPSGVL